MSWFYWFVLTLQSLLFRKCSLVSLPEKFIELFIYYKPSEQVHFSKLEYHLKVNLFQ